MITAILAFLQALPAILGGVNAFATTYFNTKAQITASRIGGDVAVVRAAMTAGAIEQQTRVAGLKVIAGSKVLLFLVLGFSMPWVIYEWKVVAWDNVMAPWFTGALGHTPAVGGDVAGWATTIISCLFGSGTAVTVGHMYFNRDKAGE